MITPVSFSSIGYQTYIIFAVINAFIFPVVYFFYPETAYRSLEEIDNIFQKTKGLRGWLTVVQVAKDEPLRYGKNGELLIDYETSEQHRRRSSVAEHREGKGTSRVVEDINKNGSGEVNGSQSFDEKSARQVV